MLCRVSHVLAKHEKPFKDGNIVKEAFLTAADSLFEHFKNRAQIMKAIKEVELSRYSVTSPFFNIVGMHLLPKELSSNMGAPNLILAPGAT